MAHLNDLSLMDRLKVYERNARHTTGAMQEHCRKAAEQCRAELQQQITYYEVITDDALRS